MAKNANDNAESPPIRRQVPARLVEATPTAHGLFNWILASPMLIFVGWFWVDIFAYISPISAYWLDVLLAMLLFVGLVVLPLGYAAHRLVTAFPRLFQNAGWDVEPLAPVRLQEQYTVRYQPVEKVRAPFTISRLWARAAQGWVYLEIVAIFVGAIAMIPLFFSALEFGFGR